jgi:hypothetical protein
MNADLHIPEALKNTGKGNRFVKFGALNYNRSSNAR